MDKEAVVKLHVYMKFDDTEMSDQQALDKLEDILNEINEKFGVDVAINVHERYVQEAL